jgi:hypothetical protein
MGGEVRYLQLRLTEDEANALAQVVTDYLAYWKGGGASKENNIPALSRIAKKLRYIPASSQRTTEKKTQTFTDAVGTTGSKITFARKED